MAHTFVLFLSVQTIRHTLDDQIRTEDTHGRNANSGLGSTISSTEAGEDDGGRAAHRAEEWLLEYQLYALPGFGNIIFSKKEAPALLSPAAMYLLLNALGEG